MQTPWHAKDISEILKELNVDPKRGLSEKEVISRQKKYGKNKLPEKRPFSFLEIFLDQLRSPLIVILIFVGFLLLALGEKIDSFLIFGVVFLNSIIGFFQEYKAQSALYRLKKVVKVKAFVLREGKKKEIFQEEIVPGDIFFLKEGEKVPADGRLIEAENLEVNEAFLTGESLPQKKETKLLPKEAFLGERKNMVFMGSIVERGRGKAVAVATGKETEIGKIAKGILEKKEEKTPLQKKLEAFSKKIAFLICLICIGLFLEGVFFSQKDPLEVLKTAIAVAVAAIPEGLPIGLTITMAVGMAQILKKRGLVRKLISAETLGSTSLILTDKTGTLTQGKMHVSKIIPFEGNLKEILKAICLCNEAFIENPEEKNPKKWKIKGAPTEKALFFEARKRGFKKEKLEKKLKILKFESFDPQKKYASLTFKENEKKITFFVGAPEKFLKKTEKKLKEKIKKALKEFTEKGFRVIGVAKKEDNKFYFLGLLLLEDPLREDAKEAIKICQKAGMRVVIITGDHKLTAKKIASLLGIKVKDDEILTGKEIEKFPLEKLKKIFKKIKIFARVEPKHKLLITKLWQKEGEVVAMTGDGINDVPALKQAHVGVALGSGTQVAKEVADLILLDDSFSTIVAAVEEGRKILENIRKIIGFLMTSCFAEIILIGSSFIFKKPLPILWMQILWINLIEDGPLSLSLAFENEKEGLMEKKPEPLTKPLLTKELKFLIFVIGIILNLILVSIFFYLLDVKKYALDRVRTIMFVGLAIDSLFFIFAFRSLRKNFWEINPFSNKFLNISWILSWFLLLLPIYLPPLQKIFHTYPLSFSDWILLLGIGILSFALIEISKLLFKIKRKA